MYNLTPMNFKDIPQPAKKESGAKKIIQEALLWKSGQAAEITNNGGKTSPSIFYDLINKLGIKDSLQFTVRQNRNFLIRK